MTNLKAIIFDFDGVIFESVGVKIDAFRQLFAQYPQEIDEIIDYHMATGGVSRYKKFDHIYKEILKKELTDEQSKELGAKFSQYGYQRVVESPFVKGAYEFLEKYHQRFLLFIASGTPHDEMLSIVKDRKLEKYFKDVYGSPATKGQIAKKILADHDLRKEEMVFVGDSTTDYEGAREAGIRFIGRIHKEYANTFSHLGLKDIIEDLDDLEKLLALCNKNY